MEQIFLKVVGDVLSVAAVGIAGLLVALLQKKLGVTQLQKVNQAIQAKHDLAIQAVQAVQQQFNDAGGQEKLGAAIDYLQAAAASHGIKISDDEIEGLVHSALKLAKLTFGEKWKEAVTPVEDAPPAPVAG
jgi:LL-H family phage holin